MKEIIFTKVNYDIFFFDQKNNYDIFHHYGIYGIRKLHIKEEHENEGHCNN